MIIIITTFDDDEVNSDDLGDNVSVDEGDET